VTKVSAAESLGIGSRRRCVRLKNGPSLAHGWPIANHLVRSSSPTTVTGSTSKSSEIKAWISGHVLLKKIHYHSPNMSHLALRAAVRN